MYCTINYQQDNWTSLLTLAEFAYNNSTHASTQETPFYINYGYHPKIDMLPAWRGESPTTVDFAKQMKELHTTMKMHLEQAQSCYKDIADVKRKKHPSFQVGDKVCSYVVISRLTDHVISLIIGESALFALKNKSIKWRIGLSYLHL